MMVKYGVSAGPRWFIGAFGAVVVLAVVSGSAIAQSHNFVLADGTKVPLTRSTTELGVVFRSYEEIDAGRERLEAAGYGVVEDIEEAPHARVKILRVAGTGDVATGDIAADAAVEDVQPVYRFTGAAAPAVSTGTIVLKLRPDVTAEQRQALWTQYGIGAVEAFQGLRDVYLVRPAAADVDEVLLAEAMADDTRALWATPDFRMAAQPAQAVQGTQALPSDKYFDYQWHLHNTGKTGVADADIDAVEAWEIADGDGVLFGMLDSGCDVDHEDLRANYIGIGQDVARPPIDDPRPKVYWDAHGTAVMGLIAAVGNSVGVRGVAYRGRFTASRGVGELPSTSAAASAYIFAMAQGVDVHNNSWGYRGGFPNPPVIVDAINEAFTRGRDLDGPGGADPLGMVIVFATGNENAENISGFELSTLPQVIAVGASTDSDTRSNFSSYGRDMEFIAPGAGAGSAEIATTDNEDGKPTWADGYNSEGINIDPEWWISYGPDIDPNGKYTGHFAGTSAAAPIAAGVAGLVLSVNPRLTATNVRILMEHTCDQVSPADAKYDTITSKSLKYGYGRINAARAAKAAQESLQNGGITWPDVPADIRVEGSTLRWRPGVGTSEFLVVEAAGDFNLVPQDGSCYDRTQAACASSGLSALPPDVSVLFVGCDGVCDPGAEQSVDFSPPVVGFKLIAIYGRNSIGRYSFGGLATVEAVPPPAVTIVALPLSGRSPLTVRFNGNAISGVGIDPTRTTWDFDADDSVAVDSTTPIGTYTYIVPPGEGRVFTARLTMVDTLGNAGTSQILIRVDGGASAEGRGVPSEPNEVQILVSVPGTPGSDLSSGASPFSVELRIESATVGSVESVSWDLGDGTRASGLVVPHTYTNESLAAQVLPITAIVTMVDSSTGVRMTTTATRLITVEPGTANGEEVGRPVLPGTEVYGSGGSTTASCGALGMVPLLGCAGCLMLLRRRRG